MENPNPNKLNLRRLTEKLGSTNVYAPVIEAVVNSIHAIEDSKRKDGEITINLLRSKQKDLLDKDGLAPIESIEVIDNGMGFNDKNKEAFREYMTENKIKKGGKGVGRLTFLKYFSNIYVDSIFADEDQQYKRRTFLFDGKYFVRHDHVENSEKKESGTRVALTRIRQKRLDEFNLKTETVARRIIEQLLYYFAEPDYKCPRILVRDASDNQTIVLNDYVDSHKEITILHSGPYNIKGEGGSKGYRFRVVIYKILYQGIASSIYLCADHRAVSKTPLNRYIPELKDDSILKELPSDKTKQSKNYRIQVYVFGKYLDDIVTPERDGFNAPRASRNRDLFLELHPEDIEKRIAEDLVYKKLSEILEPERKRRQDRVHQYVSEKAPYYKSIVGDIMKDMPQDLEDDSIELKLSEISTRRRLESKGVLEGVKKGEWDKFIENKEEIIKKLRQENLICLGLYVSYRQHIIDLFDEQLKIEDTGQYPREGVVHDIIFRRGEDSSSLDYKNHNLWLIDENLAFSAFVSSDQKIHKSRRKADTAIYHNTLFREDNKAHNPITIFEYKRPQREDYNSAEDPILQLCEYAKTYT